MSRYSEYYLNSGSNVAQLELIEIYHPNFNPNTFRIVRNAINGVTVTHEDGLQYSYQYYPLQINLLEERDNLDNGLEIVLGDLGEVLPQQLDAVEAIGRGETPAQAVGFDIEPTVKYRTYRSDDLTQPLYGPIKLELTDISFSREGASFEAKARSLNVNQTGEIYTVSRFQMLRGFLA